METRSYNGSGNNLSNLKWGAAGARLLRKTPIGYADGKSDPAARGSGPTHARAVSNALCRQEQETPHPAGLSNFVWAWGQFLDHELDLTLEQEHNPETIELTTPADDPVAGPAGWRIPFKRSTFETDADGVRQQTNAITAYIDASNVYGADEDRAFALRSLDGSGKLQTSAFLRGELLPRNDAQPPFPNAEHPGGDPASYFLAGDIRCNEHAVLAGMHTLFVREHNRRCELLVDRSPELRGRGEAIYQRVRREVGALMQVITYREFLPALLGSDPLPDYTGYDSNVDPGISNIFATACYRFGHSMLTSSIRFDDGRGLARDENLRNLFFEPAQLQRWGIDGFLGGLRTKMQVVDTSIIEDVRSFLFGPPQAAMMLDLAVLNIARGRDHGLPSFNDCREAFGLEPYADWPALASDEAQQQALASVYSSIDQLDPWIGGLVEDKHGENVGEFIQTVLVDQFRRCRDGDRFWYQNDDAFSAEERRELEAVTLAEVIRANTVLEVPDDVFHVAG